MITETTRRANSSRIASNLRNEFEGVAVDIHVSENAPCSIKSDSTTPKARGWIEIEKKDNWIETVRYTMREYRDAPIHIKNATLGGKSRVWVKLN